MFRAKELISKLSNPFFNQSEALESDMNLMEQQNHKAKYLKNWSRFQNVANQNLAKIEVVIIVHHLATQLPVVAISFELSHYNIGYFERCCCFQDLLRSLSPL